MIGWFVGSFEGMVVLVALTIATCVWATQRKTKDDYTLAKMQEQNKRDIELGNIRLKEAVEMKKLEQNLITSHTSHTEN